ncbi:uncharacterized protein LOC128639180 isoform X2 [Bombina bombina]|uniref:uncharacterized protein LOC128639180 isoform X2 n=1 Tax=Bombina bombina TaxID=8345 RepID=UPI00235AD0B4|nr:uncharacterized protein LOC128639180 isoform X2 [Bombina bombina]
MDYFIYFVSLIGSFGSSSLSLLFLWILSFVCFNKLEKSINLESMSTNTKMTGTEETNNKHTEETDTLRPPESSLANAENYLELFANWLYEEDHTREGPPSADWHIYNLQNACKELKKVKLVINSLKTENCADLKITEESKRTQRLVEYFEYIKAYIDLRQHMLNTFKKCFEVWLDLGKPLKTWIAETWSLQEMLHATVCSSKEEITKQLKLQKSFVFIQGLIAESNVMVGKLIICKATASELTDILQEINIWSENLQHLLHPQTCQNGVKKWTDELIDSISDEMEQITQRFYSVTNIIECFHIHLQDLQLMCPEKT